MPQPTGDFLQWLAGGAIAAVAFLAGYAHANGWKLRVRPPLVWSEADEWEERGRILERDRDRLERLSK